MEAVPLLLSLGALVIVSMDLALSIIWNRRARYSWSRACIVFTASVMGAIVVYVLALYSAYAFSGTPGIVLRYIWEALLAADCAFIIAMLPFFACWIVARPMHTAEKIVTIIFGCVYLGVSAAYIILEMPFFSLLQYLLWIMAEIYCEVIACVFSRNIADRSVQTMCRTLSIISFALLPLLILSCIFRWMREFSAAIALIAYSIAILVFLFIATAHQEENCEEKKEPLSSETIQEKYHITDRELEVIRLIKAGYTNKEIAYELGISVNTVNNHIANIFGKTEVRSRIDLLNLLQEASW